MPAEIDTGGPRVLHCAERADCPIQRGAPPTTTTTTTTTTTETPISRPLLAAGLTSGSPIRRARRPRRQRRRRRAIGDDSNDDDDDDDEEEEEANPSSAEPRIVPGNDERDEFFRDEASVATSSSGSGERTDFPRRRERRAIGAADDAEIATRRRSRVGPPSEEVGEAVPVDDTRQRLPIAADRPEIGGSAAYVIRLFARRCGCGCVEEADGVERPRPIFGRSAAISSQRDRPATPDETRELLCVECAWQCESFQCVRDDDARNPGDEAGKSARRPIAGERGSRRPRHAAQHKGRSYVQLALLLLLVALGHGGLVRSNAIGARRGGGFAATGVAIGAVVGAARAAPVDLDAGVRAERSANLSHITGVSRKIQMYIKNRHLQILPDGSVNGSNDDTSEYTIFQRTSVSRGQLRIQGVATCLYLCMDSCGLLYGSREYTDDCVFNETLEQHNYNSYSSVRWSTAKKTLYLGLNRWGQPRRVQAKGHNLGRLSAYARVLTQVAPPDRVEALQARMLGAQHNLRHHHNSHHHRNVQQTVCPNLPPQEKDGRDKFRCRKRKKRKKRKRRCHKGEKPGPQCEVAEEQQHRGQNAETSGEGQPQSKRSCEGAASEELCRKQALDAPAKKRKSRIEGGKGGPGDREKQHQQQQQQPRNRGKEVRPRKPEGARKPNGSGSAGNEDSRNNRPHGPNGGKRKRPKAKQTPGGSRKKVAGRVTRTSVATSPTPPAVTLPTTWYPGVSTTPTIEAPAAVESSSSWRRTKTAASPRNAVTSGELKSSDVRGNRGGKALEEVAEIPPDGSVTEATSAEIEDRSTSAFVDSSMENSEEAKSDESVLEEDPASASGEYSTVMTTMDTTPPERTEDYTRATTPSMMMMMNAGGGAFGGSIDDFRDTVKSRTGVGRLAM